MRRVVKPFGAILLLLVPGVAFAGPPFRTDDPVPTDTGHWEIYAPAIDADGRGEDWEGSAGAEINYGAAPGVQITLGLPVALAHDSNGLTGAPGDLEASIKYEFLHNEEQGVSLAIFPGLTLPTAGKGLGADKVTALLPVWGQKDFGSWSVFGGGGYAINPGVGNRDYWTGGLAVTRQIGERVTLGVEADRQGADTLDGRASTSLGVGTIVQLKSPFRLLASGGPTIADDGTTGFHLYAAIGIDL